MTLGPADIATLRRKVAWRIVPLVVLLYFIAYLDRANVGFAKLRMAALKNCGMRLIHPSYRRRAAVYRVATSCG